MPNPRQLYWLPSIKTPWPRWYLQEGYTMLDGAAGWGDPDVGWLVGGSQCTSFQTYRSRLPGPLDQWLTDRGRDFSSIHHFPIPSYQDGWARAAPQLFASKIPAQRLPRTELALWLARSLLSGNFSTVTEVESALREPHHLLRLGYQVSLIAAKQEGVQSLAFQAGLCAVGIGFRGIDLWICEHCFRRTRSHLHYCNLHSQSKLVTNLENVEKATQFQRARASRATKSRLVQANLPLQIPEGFGGIELCEHELIVGSILWPLSEEIHKDWLTAINKALESSPAVKARLPAAFHSGSHHDQLDALQRAINSREWILSRWPQLIHLAEAWLRTESLVAPGPNARGRGLSKVNSARLARAKQLLSEGCTRSDIAIELSISRSHLSHLFRRGGGKEPG